MAISTDQKLFEQMKISDSEIHNRLILVGMTPERIAVLESVSSLVDEHVDAIVDMFYISQLEIDDIAILIGDADTLYRLKKAQRQYILDLFTGRYDSSYVNHRLRIGLVHKRIGVEPKLYLSGINKLKQLLFSLLSEHIENIERLEYVKCSLDQLLYFDNTLVFDTYIESLIREVDLAKTKAEKYANGLEVQVAQRTAELERLSQIDSLTGLLNQKEMRSRLTRDIAAMQRRASHLSLIFMDIDKFKKVNDKLGHLHGDEILKSLSKSIVSSVREVDTSCRYGGDEFVIICPDADIANAKEICERIQTDFQSKHDNLSLSFGLAHTSSLERITDDDLISRADDNMYKAKRDNNIFICSS